LQSPATIDDEGLADASDSREAVNVNHERTVPLEHAEQDGQFRLPSDNGLDCPSTEDHPVAARSRADISPITYAPT